jgi:hypothetical protein
MTSKPYSRISVRLDSGIQQRLDAEVRATGKNESEILREALDAYFRKQLLPKSCLELAHRHGLIGCAKCLPADLSTSRRHFKGFGLWRGRGEEGVEYQRSLREEWDK